jgi:hypothetical protein
LNVYAVSESESGSGALQVAMTSLRIVYRARDDATPEAERDALANAFRYLLFESSCSKNVPAESAPEPDGREDMKPSPTAGAPSRKGEA